MRDFFFLFNLRQIFEKSAPSDACGPCIQKWCLKFLWVLDLNLELHGGRESPDFSSSLSRAVSWTNTFWRRYLAQTSLLLFLEDIVFTLQASGKCLVFFYAREPSQASSEAGIQAAFSSVFTSVVARTEMQLPRALGYLTGNCSSCGYQSFSMAPSQQVIS